MKGAKITLAIKVAVSGSRPTSNVSECEGTADDYSAED